MAITSTEDFPAIRAAIDITLTSKQLANAVIALPIYLGRAEAEVIAAYPDAETETDTTKIIHLKNAVVLITASLLVEAVPFLTRETFGNYQYQRRTVDLEKLSAKLRSEADAEIELVVDPEHLVSNLPTIFTVARGSRVGW